jgi:hypothetical protein
LGTAVTPRSANSISDDPSICLDGSLRDQQGHASSPQPFITGLALSSQILSAPTPSLAQPQDAAFFSGLRNDIVAVLRRRCIELHERPCSAITERQRHRVMTSLQPYRLRFRASSLWRSASSAAFQVWPQLCSADRRRPWNFGVRFGFY